MSHRSVRDAMAMLGVAMLLLLALSPLAFGGQAELTFADRDPGVHIADRAGLIDDVTRESVQARLQGELEDNGVDIVIYTQRQQPTGGRKGTKADAERLLEEWQVGGATGLGAVMFWNTNQSGENTVSGIALGSGFSNLDSTDLDEAVNSAIKPVLASKDYPAALADGLGVIEARTLDALAVPTPTPTRRPAANSSAAPNRPQVAAGQRPTSGMRPQPGPPFPDAIDDVRVYDFAEVISPVVVDAIGETIAQIEDRTGAQVVVYTQAKPGADSAAQTEQDAIDLIDQWGVGREGFDDGLAIFFNLIPGDPCHGQVQLFAAPGFRSAYLTDDERQAIFENEMLPSLSECDFDAALTAAIASIDAKATADHARNLQLARQVDAVAGLIVAPLLLIGLIAWAGWSWLRYGRDPVYLDDASILMPAPPPGLTPAAGAVIMDGKANRRALTSAMVDLASRGEIDFRSADGDTSKLSIDITVPDQRDARLARNRRVPPGPAEKYALDELKKLGGAMRTIEPGEVPRFAKSVAGFNERLEDIVADRGWFSEPPDESLARWTRRGAVILIAGIAGIFFGFNLPSTGLLLVGAAAAVAAVAMFVIARTMPQRTMEGARMYAQLAAYRRTLQKTLEQSRTMDQVVSSGVLPWVETPDQAVVWAYSFGLHEEAEEVLERSMADVRTGAASPTRTYFPLWYAVGPRSGARISGGARTPTAGLFSSGVVPDFTAMTAALTTIGSPPASSGGSGGGFGGGSSGGGGGGGGAGGGF